MGARRLEGHFAAPPPPAHWERAPAPREIWSILIFPPKATAANESLALHLWAHGDDLFTLLPQPGLDTTNWRAELATRIGVLLRNAWGGSRTWVGARAQSVLMSVCRTCWQHGRWALDFLSQLLRGPPAALALPP
jgi:hypothetical protein